MIAQLLLILMAYVLFGLEPLFIMQLSGISVFTIVFFRYIASAIVEYLLALIVMAVLQRDLSQRGIQKTFGMVLKETITNYYSAPIERLMSGRPQIIFYGFLGAMVGCIAGPFYFLSFSQIGVVMTTVIVNCLTFLLIAVVNAINKEEKMDLLKIIYLMLLVMATIITGLSYQTTISFTFTVENSLVLLITIISNTIFVMQFGREASHRIPLFKEFRLPMLSDAQSITRTGLFLRAFLKSGAFHLFGALAIIPFTGLLSLIAQGSILGEISKDFILHDLWHPELFFTNFTFVFFIIFGTILPYFGMATAASTWPRGAMRYDMWTAVLKVTQPLMGLYLGILVWHEGLRRDYVIITTILLIAVLLIRYFHDSSNLQQVIFLITPAAGRLKQVTEQLVSFKEVTAISVLSSKKIMVTVIVRSINQVIRLHKQIEAIFDIHDISYSIAPRLKFKGDLKKIMKKIESGEI